MAKSQHYCKFCKKPATVKSEEKVPAFGMIFLTFECGHTETEEIIAAPTAQTGMKLVCKLHLCPIDGNYSDHENCIWQERSALDEIPIGRDPIFARAMNFQRVGVDFFENANFNAALLDEMGLGKTIQVLLALRHNKAKLTPTLIVVKASLRLNWATEMVNNGWVSDVNDPTDYPFILLDGKSALIPGFKYYIVPMSLLEKFKTELRDFGFKLLVVDESQAFSNTTTKRTKALLEIAENIPHRICTSGTPILNRA